MLLNLAILASSILVVGGLASYLFGPETRLVPEARTALLSSGSDLAIPAFGLRYGGPYSVQGGRVLTVSWSASTVVNVYVMNQADWANRFVGAPTTFRAFSFGTSGTLSYNVTAPETLYVQVMSPVWASAKLYSWEVKLTWTELVSIDSSRQSYGLIAFAVVSFVFLFLVGSISDRFDRSTGTTAHIREDKTAQHITCPRCGRILPASYNFCPECGFDVRPEAFRRHGIPEVGGTRFDTAKVPWGGKEAFLVWLSSLILGLFSGSFLRDARLGNILAELSLVAPPLLFVLGKGLDIESLGLKPKSAVPEFAVAFGALPLALFIGIPSEWLVQALIPMPPQWQEIFKALAPRSFQDLVLLLIIMSLFVGPCEEILSRGFVQRGLESGLGDTQGLILSSLLFGVLHLNPWQFLPAFLLGILLGYIFRRRDHNLWCPIALHAFYNSGLLVLAYVGVW
jgi:membrane protease YdiL (CAAX protease family)/ribosomal protein L37E